MNVTLTRVTENPVQAVEEAASNCYDSEPTKDGRIMNACYKSGHHSVLEFADFTFHIEGVSRALLAQLTRHRVASFAVRSQRYVREDDFGFVTPNTIKSNPDATHEYLNFMEQCKYTYRHLIEYGIPAEDARFVLANSCETILEVKMNGREMIHFMNERLCNRAQWEIRDLAKQMRQCVADYNEECAKFAKMFVPKCFIHAPYSFCTEHNSCGMAPKLKDVYQAYLGITKTGGKDG